MRNTPRRERPDDNSFRLQSRRDLARRFPDFKVDEIAPGRQGTQSKFLQLAQQVDPFSPQVMLNRGRVHYFKRDPARALRAIQSSLGLDPDLEVGPLALAEAYLQNASFKEALKTLQESSVPTEDEARLAVLGRVYGLSRQSKREREILQELLEVDRHQHVSGYYFSQVYLALGETALALDWLERAAEEHSPLIVYVKVAPQFDRLRAEPRFQGLLRRIGLEQ